LLRRFSSAHIAGAAAASLPAARRRMKSQSGVSLAAKPHGAMLERICRRPSIRTTAGAAVGGARSPQPTACNALLPNPPCTTRRNGTIVEAWCGAWKAAESGRIDARNDGDVKAPSATSRPRSCATSRRTRNMKSTPSNIRFNSPPGRCSRSRAPMPCLPDPSATRHANGRGCGAHAAQHEMGEPRRWRPALRTIPELTPRNHPLPAAQQQGSLAMRAMVSTARAAASYSPSSRRRPAPQNS